MKNLDIDILRKDRNEQYQSFIEMVKTIEIAAWAIKKNPEKAALNEARAQRILDALERMNELWPDLFNYALKQEINQKLKVNHNGALGATEKA